MPLKPLLKNIFSFVFAGLSILLLSKPIYSEDVRSCHVLPQSSLNSNPVNHQFSDENFNQLKRSFLANTSLFDIHSSLKPFIDLGQKNQVAELRKHMPVIPMPEKLWGTIYK
jgi:hypothetical protein